MRDLSPHERDYISEIFRRAVVEAGKARVRFPQPNYVALKVAEEAGEVVKAAVHCAENRAPLDELEGEAVQAIAMMLRLLIEGDQVIGVPGCTGRNRS